MFRPYHYNQNCLSFPHACCVDLSGQLVVVVVPVQQMY